jgi:anti-anti-sigma factor
MESSADTLRVYVSGQLTYETLDSTESCWQAVRAAFRREVVIDLSRVTFIGSAALGSLCGLQRWLETRGCRLRIAAISPEARAILESTNLARLFSIGDGQGEAAPWAVAEVGGIDAGSRYAAAGQHWEVIEQ